MKTSPNTRKSAYTDCLNTVDAVWPTRLHRPLLAKAEIKALLETQLRAVANLHGSSVADLEIHDDHVRIRLTVPPEIALLTLITKMKTISAKVLLAAFPELRGKTSGLWSWHLFLRGAGNPSPADADAISSKRAG